MNNKKTGHGKNALRSPGGIVLLYALFSAVWITGSDRTLAYIFPNPVLFERFSTLKGLLFIAVTGTLLYVLLTNWYVSLSTAMAASTRYRERLERVLRGSNDGWWDWNLETGKIFYSPRCWEMLGYDMGDLPSDTSLWRRLIHQDDAVKARSCFMAALRNESQNFSVELRLRHKAGHYVPVLSRYMVERNGDGATAIVSGTNMDLTEQKRAEERLRQAAAVFETTREGVIIADADKRILMVNNAFCAITGYAEEEVVGKSFDILSSGRHTAEFEHDVWTETSISGHWQGEVWSRRKNGEIYPELRSISEVRSQGGIVVNYVAVFADVSRIKASERQLEYLAHHDSLTHLPNRLLLLSHLEQSIRYAHRENHRVALLMLDLDRFKDVNDSYGHAAGDDLLKQVAERLTSRLRGMDTVARLGGDEFTIIMKQISEPEDAALVATEIMRVLNKPWTLPNNIEVHIGASIGISIYPDHGETTQDLLQHADAALYQAKHDGRGRFRYFTQGMTYAARERLDMEARLHRAIENDELRVVFQPQIDIATGHIVGAEALVRWQDPAEGLIPPARFIPIAESSSLIDSISEWVLRQSCMQGKQWIDAGFSRLTIAVNISPRQLQHDGLIDTVSRILAETGFPATCLELELTESALMERNVADLLNSIRALGVRLAIDDFGTGYSSLSYLKRFPLDVLKIDKGFVDDIPHGTDRGAIAAAIVAMGHTLGFKVLAEGVENEGQLLFLQSLGCDMFQGYLASRPVSADAFETLLAQSGTTLRALSPK